MTWHMDTCDGCTWHHMTYCHHSGPDTCQCHGKHVVTKYRQNTETTACCYLILDKTSLLMFGQNILKYRGLEARISKGRDRRLMGCYDDGREECPAESEQMYSEITHITSLHQARSSELK